MHKYYVDDKDKDGEVSSLNYIFTIDEYIDLMNGLVQIKKAKTLQDVEQRVNRILKILIKGGY